MLERWRQRLHKDNKAVDLIFLSVDENPDEVATFVAKQPLAKGGPRVKSTAALERWLLQIGLNASAAIPIHVFVDPAGKSRCVRTGALLEHHYDAVAGILAADPMP